MTRRRIREAEEHNQRLFAEDGPRLRADYSTWVVARDRLRGKVLIGGLGIYGAGQMWSNDGDGVAGYQAGRMGYEDAPELDWADSEALGGGRSSHPV